MFSASARAAGGMGGGSNDRATPGMTQLSDKGAPICRHVPLGGHRAHFTSRTEALAEEAVAELMPLPPSPMTPPRCKLGNPRSHHTALVRATPLPTSHAERRRAGLASERRTEANTWPPYAGRLLPAAHLAACYGPATADRRLHMVSCWPPTTGHLLLDAY